MSSQIPDSIKNNEELRKYVEKLPSKYNFEVYKTIWRIQKANATRVALQFPEGLQIYACTLADIIEKFTSADVVILSDAVYGACCVDDYTARALGADFLVHYGHSCLVPVDQMVPGITVMYVFVTIQVEHEHFVELVKSNLTVGKKLVLFSTIQFINAIHAAKPMLELAGYGVNLVHVRPLSPGEVLGCTAPRFATGADIAIYFGDGRFHLEGMMLANPHLPTYQYDPYSKKLTLEEYGAKEVLADRSLAIEKARNARTFGIILGTLGRQGSLSVVKYLREKIEAAGRECFTLLVSEISAEHLEQFRGVDAWIQTCCPRLSIDWGTGFCEKPLLTPYELAVALGHAQWADDHYPMEQYANNSSGPWTPNNALNKKVARPVKV